MGNNFISYIMGDDKCACGPFKRGADDHNSCLKKVGLGGGFSTLLFVLSIIFMGQLSRFCYMCCSKQENAPRWIWKDWMWLDIWMGLTYGIVVGWIWDIIFNFHAMGECKGKEVKTCENCC